MILRNVYDDEKYMGHDLTQTRMNKLNSKLFTSSMLKIAIPIDLDALLLRAHGELSFPSLHLNCTSAFRLSCR